MPENEGAESMHTVEQMVIKGIEEEGVIVYLNNFYYHFKYPKSGESLIVKPYRELYTDEDQDKLFKEIFHDQKGLSETFLSQTPRKHFALIDKLADEHNIIVPELSEINSEDSLRDFDNQIVPIFIQLLEDGYSLTDLRK